MKYHEGAAKTRLDVIYHEAAAKILIQHEEAEFSLCIKPRHLR